MPETYIFFGLTAIGILVLIISLAWWFKHQQEVLLGTIALNFEQQQTDRIQVEKHLEASLKETHKTLQEEFYRMNLTVDNKLSHTSKDFNSRLDRSTEVIGKLQKELTKMGQIGSKIEHMDRLMRAPKVQGGVGEETLEEILQSIFPTAMWNRQQSLGNGLIVDAVVKTSNGLIPIDVKFPVSSFERLLNAENKKDIEAERNTFTKIMKGHINAVARYIQPQADTVDFAIMFLPNENLYYECIAKNRALDDYARKKQVLVCGPNTLLYTLKIIFQAYQSQVFALKAEDAMKHLAGIKLQAQHLDEAIRLTSLHLGRANTQIAGVQIESQKLQSKLVAIEQIGDSDLALKNIS